MIESTGSAALSYMCSSLLYTFSEASEVVTWVERGEAGLFAVPLPLVSPPAGAPLPPLPGGSSTTVTGLLRVVVMEIMPPLILRVLDTFVCLVVEPGHKTLVRGLCRCQNGLGSCSVGI